jgi:hypothetical protein
MQIPRQSFCTLMWHHMMHHACIAQTIYAHVYAGGCAMSTCDCSSSRHVLAGVLFEYAMMMQASMTTGDKTAGKGFGC